VKKTPNLRLSLQDCHTLWFHHRMKLGFHLQGEVHFEIWEPTTTIRANQIRKKKKTKIEKQRIGLSRVSPSKKRACQKGLGRKIRFAFCPLCLCYSSSSSSHCCYYSLQWLARQARQSVNPTIKLPILMITCSLKLGVRLRNNE